MHLKQLVCQFAAFKSLAERNNLHLHKGLASNATHSQSSICKSTHRDSNVFLELACQHMQVLSFGTLWRPLYDLRMCV